MIFEALPARFGDCLLLQVPDKKTTRLMVIDGGPGTVFRDSLAPRLNALSEAATLPIDAVMVSHVDADHIVGILDLFSAIQKAKVASKQPPYRVGQLIFNSFDRIVDAPPAEVGGGDTSFLKSLSNSSSILESHTAQEVLASVAQGSALSDLARGLKITLNPPAKTRGGLLCVSDKKTAFDFGEARFDVVGPRAEELSALQKEWAKWRKKKDAEALKALAAYADKSVPNLSSIVALVTWTDKTILLTGDARGDYILRGLEMAGLIGKNPNPLKAPLDILKLPHHGSIRNVDVDFFRRLPARHYVASGDGWYGNPDRETLEMIDKVRPEGGYTVHLTYPADHMDEQHKLYLAQRNPPETFTPSKHAVAPVVADLRKKGVVVEVGPVRIDLGEG